MKYWKYILKDKLSFNEAEDLIHKYKSYYVTRPYYMTRPEWDGVHFYDKLGRYDILFKDGHVEYNMYDKVWDKDKSDWMIVSITNEAIRILKGKNLT